MKYKYQPVAVPDHLLNDPELKHLAPMVLGILAKRGFLTRESIINHLETPLSTVLNSPPMKDLDIGVQRIAQAVRNQEGIVIYRDYDCDGCTAGAIAVECLTHLGATVSHFSNDRVRDGYGMCNRGIDEIKTNLPETKLLVTVDNGIAALSQIDYAVSQGFDVVVTDHHTPGEQLPNALAVIDPKRKDEIAEFRDLCGAGVIFKVMIALFRELGEDITPVLDTLDLVAVATVADVVPMLGENRVLVREGIAKLLQRKRPFFDELLTQKKLETVTAHGTIGFQISPLINAVSRMELNTNLVVDAMLSHDRQVLKSTIATLIQNNEDRKEKTAVAVEVIDKDLLHNNINPETVPCILVGTDVSSGLVGIVAGRLCEKYQKVVGVFHKDGAHLKGSMRGVDGFDIKSALDKVTKGVLVAYGGHSKAAGLTVTAEKYPIFVEEFTKIVEESFPNGPVETPRNIDWVMASDSECTVQLVRDLTALEPLGEEFPAPLFGINGTITNTSYMSDGVHVKHISDNGVTYLHFGYGEEAMRKGTTPKKFVGVPEINAFRGKVSVQFNCEYESEN